LLGEISTDKGTNKAWGVFTQKCSHFDIIIYSKSFIDKLDNHIFEIRIRSI
jgi:hypothetical protein